MAPAVFECALIGLVLRRYAAGLIMASSSNFEYFKWPLLGGFFFEDWATY
jgi:hypothetical protein